MVRGNASSFTVVITTGVWSVFPIAPKWFVVSIEKTVTLPLKERTSIPSNEREIKSMMVFNEDVDKWRVIWEYMYNEKEKEFKDYLGHEESYNLVDKLNPRDSVKGGQTEVFRMHVMVKDPNVKSISYWDVNSLYPFVMSTIEFAVGHLIIRRGDESCRNLLRGLERKGKKFIGLCQVRVLAPGNLMIPSLARKIDGKLMFLLCTACSLD